MSCGRIGAPVAPLIRTVGKRIEKDTTPSTFLLYDAVRTSGGASTPISLFVARPTSWRIGPKALWPSTKCSKAQKSAMRAMVSSTTLVAVAALRLAVPEELLHLIVVGVLGCVIPACTHGGTAGANCLLNWKPWSWYIPQHCPALLLAARKGSMHAAARVQACGANYSKRCACVQLHWRAVRKIATYLTTGRLRFGGICNQSLTTSEVGAVRVGRRC